MVFIGKTVWPGMSLAKQLRQWKASGVRRLQRLKGRLTAGTLWLWHAFILHKWNLLLKKKEPIAQEKQNLITWKKKKNLLLQKTLLSEIKFIIYVLKISLSVHSARVIFGGLCFFAVFKFSPCFRQKKYTNHT